ncbi:DUF3592 domain-containing protein [Corynebacterium fournieri]|uniref:DUF3592 domain-containing protein n=1 Tax=Corynebacterium fournieri TaxID=1852390 RepID=UPI000A2F642A|nr:DUF3592 domain-containing protein [Corynebacterium fournieri]WJY96726.1 hypothetical protein CFOUR_01420 [Corynebacterium fournieri]
MRWRRRAHQVVLALYAFATLGSVAMVAGPALNDARIQANPGRGTAIVTEAGRMRTFVEYQTEDGQLVSPPRGLLYPTGLGEGQQVWVTYDKTDPDLVKVEGRGWALALLPALSMWAVATLVAAAAWFAAGRWVPEG